MKYSVIIPIYNEEESIKHLYNALREVLDPINHPYEIIFINDGSTDRSKEILMQLEREREREGLLIVELKENRGQTAALKAGFIRAHGETVISMDGDLQNDPRDIPLLLAKMNEGYEVVCGWRYKRQDSWLKKHVSLIANKLQNLLLGTDLHDISCTFRAYKCDCLKNLNLERGGLHRFIPYLLQKRGYKITEIKVNHHPRIYGSSKYGIVVRGLNVINDFFYLVFKRKE